MPEDVAPELALADKHARRMLELAALVAAVALLILVIDFTIKQSIVKAAREAQDAVAQARKLTGQPGPGERAGARGDVLGDVGDAAPLESGHVEDSGVWVPGS